jgi:hypothetical protein
MNENRKPWFNFLYKVAYHAYELGQNYVPSGEIIPNPVRMFMTLDEFLKTGRKLRRSSSQFLELACEKIESPQNNPESVEYINNLRAAFGGQLTRALPDVTTDMGFGEMYLRIYVCRDKIGTITVKSSTGNEFANAIGLYGFTESGFKETVNKLGLQLR